MAGRARLSSISHSMTLAHGRQTERLPRRCFGCYPATSGRFDSCLVVLRHRGGNRQLCDRDCVALLSGGLDSLIGGIDATAQGRRPIFVSQLAFEDSARQIAYAHALGGGEWHQQWSHKVVFGGKKETSTRARSMAFYGLAVLATSLLTVNRPEILVPENGFISINPPLLPGRMASLSTRTTHPQFMGLVQILLDAIGVDAHLSMPYRFKTKGEMLEQCADQVLLAKYGCDTTSCGRFRTYNRTHCGRCVPCMVRKAAVLRWGVTDTTTYKFSSLSVLARRVRTIPWRWPVRYWPPSSGESIRFWGPHFLLLPRPIVNTIGALLRMAWLSWQHYFEEMACCDGFSLPLGSLP
jgi:hypothetical protein